MSYEILWIHGSRRINLGREKKKFPCSLSPQTIMPYVSLPRPGAKAPDARKWVRTPRRLLQVRTRFRCVRDLIADCYGQTVDARSSCSPSQTALGSSRICLVTRKAFRHSDGGCLFACVGQPNRVIRNLGREPHG